MNGVAVCVPTVDRPEAVERLLESLAIQTCPADAIVVVDASDDDATRLVCDRMTSTFGEGVLEHLDAERGLTDQRRAAIERVRELGGIGFVCMLDDDIVLEPAFLSEAVGFLTSPSGADYGGVSGYDVLGWGRPWDGLSRFYSKLRLYDGELRPGRWLYCGCFLELSHLAPQEGVFDTDFVGGGLTVWRIEVFDSFQPPRAMGGYALLEDKHLSLRVGTRYRLGVVGSARLRHERAVGGRPMRFAMGFAQVRREALLLRDCDPRRSLLRYVVFLVFSGLDLAVQFVLNAARMRWRQLPRLLGRSVGLASCIVGPPRTTADALPDTGERGAGRR